MPLIDDWINETTCSALPGMVKEWICYLTIASVAQAQGRRFKYVNAAGQTLDLPHAKILSVSAIITGKPGSYKSESVKLIRRVLEASKLVWIYPHDQVSREFLLTTLAQEQAQQNIQWIASTITVDELVNFLNRREYVEPLIGTLNALLDQPDVYTVGTQRRATETIKRPRCNCIWACAPSWFKYLPEALFTGGFAGRVMFYEIPYPQTSDRQPRGGACLPGAEDRLARGLQNMPNGHLLLTNAAIQLHDQWELEWGKEDAHPLPVLDEWYKRRTVNTVRLAGAVALSRNTNIVDIDEMYEANKHLEHVRITLEKMWFEVDADAATAHKMLQQALMTGPPKTLREIEALAVKYVRSPMQGQRILSWWIDHGMLIRNGDKFSFA